MKKELARMLSHYLFSNHLAGINADPLDYDLPKAKKISQNQIFLALIRIKDNEGLYDYLEDWVKPANPVFIVLLDSIQGQLFEI